MDAAKTFFVNCLWAAGLRRIDVTGSEEQIKKLEQHVRSVWARYGQTDPYFSVLTADKFHAAHISSADIDEFYATGLNDFNSTLECCKRNGVTANFGGTVLDFGCGLGRIGEHLSKSFACYIGVDISKPHLDQASARFDALGRKNGQFRLLPDILKNPKPVDFIFSLIVLQHNPPPMIAVLIAHMCTMLRPGGLLCFQVPISLENYRFRLESYLANLPSHGAVEMHCLPKRDVARILKNNGCDLLEAASYDYIGDIGVSYRFLARKRGFAGQRRWRCRQAPQSGVTTTATSCDEVPLSSMT